MRDTSAPANPAGWRTQPSALAGPSRSPASLPAHEIVTNECVQVLRRAYNRQAASGHPECPGPTCLTLRQGLQCTPSRIPPWALWIQVSSSMAHSLAAAEYGFI